MADFIGATRGTAFQTLKALRRKGAVEEERSEKDRGSIRCKVTDSGKTASKAKSHLVDALEEAAPESVAALRVDLEDILRRSVRRNGGRPFEVCRTCRHFQTRPAGGYCAPFTEDLSALETGLLCHEQEPSEAMGGESTGKSGLIAIPA